MSDPRWYESRQVTGYPSPQHELEDLRGRFDALLEAHQGLNEAYEMASKIAKQNIAASSKDGRETAALHEKVERLHKRAQEAESLTARALRAGRAQCRVLQSSLEVQGAHLSASYERVRKLKRVARVAWVLVEFFDVEKGKSGDSLYERDVTIAGLMQALCGALEATHLNAPVRFVVVPGSSEGHEAIQSHDASKGTKPNGS